MNKTEEVLKLNKFTSGNFGNDPTICGSKTDLLIDCDIGKQYQSTDNVKSSNQPLLREYIPPLNRGVYWVMVLLGAGQLYPYQTVITAADYFDVVFPGKKVTYLSTTILMYPSTMFSLIFIKYGHKIPFSIRIIVSCLVMGLGLTVIPFFVTMPESSGLLAVLLVVGITGALMTMNMCGIYGFSALLPQIYTQGMMTGQAVAGVTVSLTRILTKYFYPGSNAGIQAGGKLFFIIGAVWLLFCAIGFGIIMRGSFTKHYIKKYRESKRDLLITRAMSSSIFSENNNTPIENGLVRRSRPWFREVSGSCGLGNSPSNFSFRKYLRRNFDGDVPDDHFKKPSTPTWDSVPSSRTMQGSGRNSSSTRKTRTSYRKINKRIFKLGLSVVLVFFGTFLPFPGLIVTLESQYEFLGDGWFAILLITEFTIFDTIGRYSAGYTKCGLTKERLWLPIFLRFLLYPVFLLYYMRFYHNEWLIIGANAVLALSNGFIVTIAMMLAPGQLIMHEREVGGAIMGFYAQFGILSGCAGALLVNTILNSFGY